MRVIGVAIDVPEPWGSYLNRCRAQAGDPQAEYVPTHLTLLPPTEIGDDAEPVVERHLAQVAARHAGFSLLLRGTGTFRPITDVVFVAVAAGISECERLAADVRSGPLEREIKYPYHPHITVAQDVPQPALDQVFTDLAGFEVRFDVVGFRLFVHNGDSRWRPRRDFALTA
ncbi:phosphoesterase [Actinocatenispora thailandica]|uniref:Phosphoesterase n=1 Tax=Actinocatenispora thailandica TaxID=227318 RepID=A0A7R7DTT6_9ACTN|nr:2'-5' RNA ligase family protein [Actinocatenispora thailandica]BCJ37693.1 phosphoesterase [Actinocatenispora thailandica]